METWQNVLVALAVLLLLDFGNWQAVQNYLATDYERTEVLVLRPGFPNQKTIRIAKILIGLLFVTSFVAALKRGASEHLGLTFCSFAMVLLFGVVSGWESFKAFRHYASNHYTLRPRGGYRRS